jgi:hypothetical protein
MSIRLVAGALLLFVSCFGVQAAPGDPYVPAHRTRDGHYVPPNVPPLSAGTHLSKQPRRSSALHRPSHQTHADRAAPTLASAGTLPR